MDIRKHKRNMGCDALRVSQIKTKAAIVIRIRIITTKPKESELHDMSTAHKAKKNEKKV